MVLPLGEGDQPYRSRGWTIAALASAAWLIFLLGAWVATALGADAMGTCQLSHSFDTCFLALEG